MKNLSSRQRVLQAISRQEPDRVPIGFGGAFDTLHHYPSNSGNSRGGYLHLCEYMGFTDCRSPVVAQQGNIVINVDNRILEKFGSDLRWIYMNQPKLKLLPDGTLQDLLGIRLKRAGKTIFYTNFPLANAETQQDILNFPNWADPSDPLFTRGIRERAQRLHDAGYAVATFPGYAGQIFHLYTFLRGFEQWLIDPYINPRLFTTLSERIVDWSLEVCKHFYDVIHDLVDIAVYGDDMGSQTSTLFSPSDFRKFIKPWMTRYVQGVKSISGAKLMLHCCGAIEPLIVDFIEMGIDILNPVQPLARGMELDQLKAKYGHDICFYGGMDVQKLLTKGTPDHVAEEVERTLDVMKPGGGYIFAPSHNFQDDVPPENIVSMYETALRCGVY